MDVDFDHARVGRDANDVQARIDRGRVALDLHRHPDLFGRSLGGRDQFEIVLEPLDGGEENAQGSIARLDGDGGSDGAVDVAEPLLDALLGGPFRRGERGDPLRALPRIVKIGQRSARLGRIGLDDIGVGGGRNIRQRAQRQPIADRAVAGNEMQRAAAGFPFLAAPARFLSLGLPALNRQHISGRLGQAPREDAGDPVARFRVLELRILGRHVRGEIGLFDEPFRGILVSRRDIIPSDAQFGGDRAEQGRGLIIGRAGLGALRGDARRVAPDRLSVAPPIERERPARQRFARIPFALPIVQEPAGGELISQAPDQRVGERALGRADRVRVPLARFEVVDRNESRLAAHGEAHVVALEPLVDLVAQSVERRPRVLGKRLRDARMFGDPLDAHVEVKIDIGETRDARDRRGVAIMGRRGERNMAFAGQEPRGRIESDPARAGKIDLGPGVQIGEVVVRAGGPVERDPIRLELNEVAGHEPRRETQIAQDLHQKPARIAARARAALERLLRALHPRLHADHIGDFARQAAIELDHEIDRAPKRAIDCAQERRKPRACGLGRAVDDKIGPQVLAIFERPDLRALLDEEIERIVDRHVGDDVDLNSELVDELGKHIAREPVAVWVLLMVHEMIGG